MTFERIVRPFQKVDFTPPPAPVAPETPLENVVLMIGKEGASAKMLVGNSSGEITSFHEDKQKEVSRTTIERRVENPDDPSQYVNVADTDKIKTKGGKKDTFKQMEIAFKPQE